MHEVFTSVRPALNSRAAQHQTGWGEVILMDEPRSALDPIATLRIEELIEELKSRVPIVIVTHNLQQAGRVADRTAFMLDGRLVEVGPTLEIFTTPKDPRTEEYVTGKFG